MNPLVSGITIPTPSSDTRASTSTYSTMPSGPSSTSNRNDIFFHVDEEDWRSGRFWLRERPPDELGLVLGDFIQNVRAALDQSIFALGVEQSERSEFPIHSDERQYIGTDDTHPVSRRDLTLAKLPDEYRTVIDAAQPYRRGTRHAIREDPLAILASLSNADKHRVVHPALIRQWGRPRFVVSSGRIRDVQTRYRH